MPLPADKIHYANGDEELHHIAKVISSHYAAWNSLILSDY